MLLDVERSTQAADVESIIETRTLTRDEQNALDALFASSRAAEEAANIAKKAARAAENDVRVATEFVNITKTKLKENQDRIKDLQKKVLRLQRTLKEKENTRTRADIRWLEQDINDLLKEQGVRSNLTTSYGITNSSTLQAKYLWRGKKLLAARRVLKTQNANANEKTAMAANAQQALDEAVGAIGSAADIYIKSLIKKEHDRLEERRAAQAAYQRTILENSLSGKQLSTNAAPAPKASKPWRPFSAAAESTLNAITHFFTRKKRAEAAALQKKKDEERQARLQERADYIARVEASFAAIRKDMASWTPISPAVREKEFEERRAKALAERPELQIPEITASPDAYTIAAITADARNVAIEEVRDTNGTLHGIEQVRNDNLHVFMPYSITNEARTATLRAAQAAHVQKIIDGTEALKVDPRSALDFNDALTYLALDRLDRLALQGDSQAATYAAQARAGGLGSKRLYYTSSHLYPKRRKLTDTLTARDVAIALEVGLGIEGLNAITGQDTLPSTKNLQAFMNALMPLCRQKPTLTPNTTVAVYTSLKDLRTAQTQTNTAAAEVRMGSVSAKNRRPLFNSLFGRPAQAVPA